MIVIPFKLLSFAKMTLLLYKDSRSKVTGTGQQNAPLKIMILNFILKYIGFLAAFCTTFAFFPQAVKVWKTKSTKDISLYMFIIFTVGVFSWLIYGITISDIPIILANAATLILSLFILVYKIKYK